MGHASQMLMSCWTMLVRLQSSSQAAKMSVKCPISFPSWTCWLWSSPSQLHWDSSSMACLCLSCWWCSLCVGLWKLLGHPTRGLLASGSVVVECGCSGQTVGPRQLSFDVSSSTVAVCCLLLGNTHHLEHTHTPPGTHRHTHTTCSLHATVSYPEFILKTLGCLPHNSLHVAYWVVPEKI